MIILVHFCPCIPIGIGTVGRAYQTPVDISWSPIEYTDVYLLCLSKFYAGSILEFQAIKIEGGLSLLGHSFLKCQSSPVYVRKH